jgi:hypothetical protein
VTQRLRLLPDRAPPKYTRVLVLSRDAQDTPRAVRKPTAYWEYIKVEELLSLQGGLESDDRKLANDEVMFITIHQIDELWLKLALRELESARDLFVRRSPCPSSRSRRRCAGSIA